MKKILVSILLLIAIVAVAVINDFFPIKHHDTVVEVSEKLDIDKTLVFAMIKVESDFRERVVSHKGAVGLMQVLPTTAEWILEKNDYIANDYDLYRAADNIFVGTLYLKYLTERFDGDLVKIMAAYNGGSSRIKNDRWKEIEETRFYVKKVRIAHFFYKIKFAVLEVF